MAKAKEPVKEVKEEVKVESVVNEVSNLKDKPRKMAGLEKKQKFGQK